VPGLALEVGAPAGRSRLNYRTTAGIRRRLKIGLAGGVTLGAARALAMKALAAVSDGDDPAADRKEARAAAQSVRAYLDEVYAPKVLAHRKDGGAPKDKDDSGSGTYARIRNAWKTILDLQLAQVSRDAIEKVLGDRREAGKQAGTLLRDWSAFRAMLTDAVDRGQLAAVPMARRPEPIRKLRGTSVCATSGSGTRTRRGRGLDGGRAPEALAAFSPTGQEARTSCDARPGSRSRPACAAGDRAPHGQIVNLRERRIVPAAHEVRQRRTITSTIRSRRVEALEDPREGRLARRGQAEDVAEDSRTGSRRGPARAPGRSSRISHFRLQTRFRGALRACGSLRGPRCLRHSSVLRRGEIRARRGGRVREAVLGMQAS
jgi:hypothetical protein